MDKDQLVRDLVAQLRAEEAAERQARELAEIKANRGSATVLADLAPCQVQVIRHALDGRDYVCDEGRIGWVHTATAADRWVLVDDMSPGDDGNPSRLLQPRNLIPVERQR
jgi:hypothetical protein